MTKIYIAERADGKGSIYGSLTYINGVPYIKADKKYSRKIKVMEQSLKEKK